MKTIKDYTFFVKTLNIFDTKAQFKRQTFHEPNLIVPIKYMTTDVRQMLVGLTRELSLTWPVGQFDYRATLIQMLNFSCTEPNSYITSTLNKLFFTQSSYFCHAHTACFDLLEQSGRKSGKICVPLALRVRNILA